ncbi:glycoside hydrolase family 43 protein [Paenactinomyces guangxiensis]|uniref:Glycoside hydrolase family 43 protein n=1 Tax=Paenactinomyces guangxiensis TaxID=1490290 RepID=A0A7W1WPG2_9BACL|nr:glycoside hydrolase family 43 protein [Paenactinomyces guangxiensis]MBA4493499.1 glycoside hydrolase family 43 protein [Paenactinomyces guangxiensis]MBH8590590.1 glycoside hydrolase family 43 protein [Paenactinomyces guangxiensis]
MSKIVNPILRGFNPDPSIIRVGDDYYIATSTFEWFPGVQIHHSKDLKNWRLLTHPLARKSQLDMIGNPDSGGVWAPCLSYSDGTFYLVFTDVKSHLGPFKDTHNYLVTAKDIKGPWSDPIYLNSSGFDPSLFHDEDGKKWLLNMVWDHRKGKNSFGGILLQEYSVEEQRLVGPIYNIFRGTELGLTEGPHIYKHNRYYYLMTAEGGTRFGHAVTVARSKSLFGPYQVDPFGPILTSSGKPELELQRAGHASLVETQNNEWYIAHLCGRPLRPSMNCNLGRETALQRVEWTGDGWLRLVGGGNSPHVEVQGPVLPEHPFAPEPQTEHFDGKHISIHLQSLREPLSEEWVSIKKRPGFLRLTGRESLSSTHRQSMIARRQQSFTVEAETVVQFSPETYQHLAGLIYYYNTKNYYYLWISHDEQLGKCLGIMTSDRGMYDEPLETPVSIEGWERVYLKVKIHFEQLQFYYSQDGVNWIAIGPVLDASKISDENVELVTGGYRIDQGFTGAFIGLCVQDLSGQKKYADFDYFTYRELDRQ